MGAIHGLVIHITDGHNHKLPSLGGVWSHFNNPATKASAHFCISKKGEIWQFVDTDDRAWAQGVGNSNWISVENIALPGQRLTDSQLDGVATILSWLSDIAGVPLTLANTPSASGLGFHSMFPTTHHCPGPVVVAQRGDIITRAEFGTSLPVGTWNVQVGSWTWIYTFNTDGTAKWTDIRRPPIESGGGNWYIPPPDWVGTGRYLEISWGDWTDRSGKRHPGSREQWVLPLKSSGQQGTLVGKAPGPQSMITANKVF